MPLGKDDVMKFGKHKGESIEDLIYDQPDYVLWLYDNEVVEFDEETTKLLEDRKII